MNHEDDALNYWREQTRRHRFLFERISEKTLHEHWHDMNITHQHTEAEVLAEAEAILKERSR